jgi:peptidyl-prolyl cis-trans isomerase D
MKKIVLGGLLLIICVMMIITLVPGGLFGDYFGVTTSGVLAKVGDQEVNLAQVNQQAKMIGRQQFRGNVPPQLMPYLMQRAADNIISQKALVYEADHMGLGASNEEVRNFLHQGQWGDAVFPGGNFIGQPAYESFIQNQFGLSVAQFEHELKDKISQDKLLATITAATTVSDKDVTAQVNKQDTKVKLEYAVLTMADVEKQINPTDAELKAFYDQNKQSYVNSIPEKRKARYIIIDAAKIGEKVQVSQEDLQKYYSQHQDEFRIPETVTVRHILIKTPAPGADGKVDQAGVDAAKAKADDILKQLKSGASFAELAKKNSDDPGSAQNGGLLPPLTRGRTVPEFEQAAFNTPKGQMTGVIRTSYGFHIILVEDKQTARLRPLDEVKAQIEPNLKQQMGAAEAQKLANTVQTISRTSSMDKAAADKGLTITTTDLIAKGSMLPGVGNAQDLLAGIFSTNKDNPPETAPVPQGYAVYQVTEIVQPQTPTFEQAKAQVEQQYKGQRAQSLLAQKTQQLSDRARAQHDLNKAAKEVGATVKTSDLVDASGQVPDIGPLTGSASVAFSMKQGDISGPLQSAGNGVVLTVLEKQEPSADQVKQNWDRAKDTLLQEKRNEIEALYVQNLRDKLEKEGKIKINKKEMERLATATEGS